MSLPPARRTAVFLLLAVLLLVPGAATAAPRSVSPSFLPRLWSLLAALWPDAGCLIDPDGLCKGTATVDEGCGIDPDGRCKGTASALPATIDEGCGIDPSGRRKGTQAAFPVVPASADAGCGIDPSGNCLNVH